MRAQWTGFHVRRLEPSLFDLSLHTESLTSTATENTQAATTMHPFKLLDSLTELSAIFVECSLEYLLADYVCIGPGDALSLARV